MMQNKTFFDVCSGIGGGRLGLEKCGLKSIGYSDTSRLAETTYKLLFNTDNEKNYGNIKRIKANDLPDFDVLIAGFPCQSFSVIGRKEGFDDPRGQLIFYIAEIINSKRPKCFLLENVKGLVTHDNGNTFKAIIKKLESINYEVVYKVIKSTECGIPQNRQRVYIVGFNKDYKFDISNYSFPSNIKKKSIKNFLVNDIKATKEDLYYFNYYLKNSTNKGKYTLKDILDMEGKILDRRMNDLRIYSEYMPTLRAQKDGIFYVNNHELYSLSGYEALLFQGFGKRYANKVKNIVSNRHLLMQAGNAMTVNVIYEIGKTINKFVEEEFSL